MANETRLQRLDYFQNRLIKDEVIQQNNKEATTPPTSNDDSSIGYSEGSEWIDTVTGIKYTCVNSAVGAAEWIAISDDVQNNFAGALPPDGATDDESAGYAVGSVWVDIVADISYVCVDASTGAAIWNKLSSIDGISALNTTIFHVDYDAPTGGDGSAANPFDRMADVGNAVFADLTANYHIIVSGSAVDAPESSFPFVAALTGTMTISGATPNSVVAYPFLISAGTIPSLKFKNITLRQLPSCSTDANVIDELSLEGCIVLEDSGATKVHSSTMVTLKDVHFADVAPNGTYSIFSEQAVPGSALVVNMINVTFEYQQIIQIGEAGHEVAGFLAENVSAPQGYWLLFIHEGGATAPTPAIFSNSVLGDIDPSALAPTFGWKFDNTIANLIGPFPAGTSITMIEPLLKVGFGDGVPGANDDILQGYEIGSTYINGLAGSHIVAGTWESLYRCVRADEGSAKWAPITIHHIEYMDNPLLTDDEENGYPVGSTWRNTTTGVLFQITDGTTGAAQWDVIIPRSNYTAILPPAGATDDITLGYYPGSRWYDTNLGTTWTCVDNTDGAAVWIQDGPEA